MGQLSLNNPKSVGGGQPLGGGGKYCRFRNITMNISHDEYGPVEIDELTAIHNAKMEKRIEMSERHTENDCELMSKTEHQKMSKDNDTGSQECVGRVTKVSWKRPLIEKGPYGRAHNIKGGRTPRRSYADVVAK